MSRPRTDYYAQTKVCQNCGAVYHRRPREYSGIWEHRKYCSRECAQRGQIETKRQGIRNRLGPAPRAPDIEERLVNFTEFGGYQCPLGGGCWDKFGHALGA